MKDKVKYKPKFEIPVIEEAVNANLIIDSFFIKVENLFMNDLSIIGGNIDSLNDLGFSSVLRGPYHRGDTRFLGAYLVDAELGEFVLATKLGNDKDFYDWTPVGGYILTDTIIGDFEYNFILSVSYTVKKDGKIYFNVSESNVGVGVGSIKCNKPRKNIYFNFTAYNCGFEAYYYYKISDKMLKSICKVYSKYVPEEYFWDHDGPDVPQN